MEGGVASGFKPVEVEKVEPRLFVVKGRRGVRVTQVYLNSPVISPVSLLPIIKYIRKAFGIEQLSVVTRSIIQVGYLCVQKCVADV